LSFSKYLIREIDYILILRKDVKFNRNPNEVKDTKYVSQKELKDFLLNAEKSDIPITPWFKLIVNNFLFSWWDNIDNLQVNDNKIHKMV